MCESRPTSHKGCPVSVGVSVEVPVSIVNAVLSVVRTTCELPPASHEGLVGVHTGTGEDAPLTPERSFCWFMFVLSMILRKGAVVLKHKRVGYEWPPTNPNSH